MKKLFSFFLTVLTVCAFAFSAAAEESPLGAPLADYRGTFSQEQTESLMTSLADTLAESDTCGVIMISDAFESITFEDAIEYCEEQGFTEHNCCVAMVYSFDTNDICIYDIKDNMAALSSETLAYFEFEVYSQYSSYADGVFSNDAIYSASELFCDKLSDIGINAKNGTPVTAEFFSNISGTEDYSADSTLLDKLPDGVINEYELKRKIPENRLVPRLVDDAELLNPAEEDELLERLDELSEKHELDIIIVTKQSIGSKTSTEYADDYYDYNGCGYGINDDGILFLISMENRDWAISTYGNGIKYFTDAGQDYMKDQFLPLLRTNDYYSAFHKFADLCDDFCTQAENGRPYDYGNLPRKPFSFISLVIAAVIALIIAFSVCTHYKKQLTSVAFKKGAADYFRPGSFVPGIKDDIFLYKNVAKVRRQSSSGGGGGGSSTHHSSSGRSHGGSHGHF